MINESPRRSDTHPSRSWLIVVYIVVLSVAVDSALLLSVASERSWIGSLLTVFAVALITAGMLFTVLEMLKLGRSRPPQ